MLSVTAAYRARDYLCLLEELPLSRVLNEVDRSSKLIPFQFRLVRLLSPYNRSTLVVLMLAYAHACTTYTCTMKWLTMTPSATVLHRSPDHPDHRAHTPNTAGQIETTHGMRGFTASASWLHSSSSGDPRCRKGIVESATQVLRLDIFMLPALNTYE
jgi:hypothetical protein